MPTVKEMFATYVNLETVPETNLLVFENHVEELIKRMQDEEQYTESIVEFDVSQQAKIMTDKFVTQLEELYKKEVTSFEQSMLLLHIGNMIDQS